MNTRRRKVADAQPPRWLHEYMPCQNPDHQPLDHCNFCFMPEDWSDHVVPDQPAGGAG